MKHFEFKSGLILAFDSIEAIEPPYHCYTTFTIKRKSGKDLIAKLEDYKQLKEAYKKWSSNA